MVEDVEQIESAFESLASEYPFRKKLAENQVLEWHWATFTWFDLRPLHFERCGIRPGRRLRRAPADRYGRNYYGLDQKGRVVVERDFNEFGFYETFYNWNCHSVEVVHFDYGPEKKPINFMMVRYSENRPTSSSTSAIASYQYENYRWNGDLISQVDLHVAERRQGSLEKLRLWHTAHATYDDKRVLQRVELHWPTDLQRDANDSAEVKFERRGKRIYRPHP